MADVPQDPYAPPTRAGGSGSDDGGDRTTQEPPPAGRQRPLGTISLASLVVANMIGAGVYTTSGFSLADLHRPEVVLGGWMMAGVIALLGALCYGGLARGLAESGGEYLFLARGVHPAVGFLAGWISLTAGFSGAIAFAAKTSASYLPNRLLEWGVGGDFWAIALVLLLTGLNLTDLKLAARTQNLVVLLKMFALVAFVLYGLAVIAGRWGTLSETTETAGVASLAGSQPRWAWGALASSLMWISFSYAGYNAAIYVAGVADRGTRTVPRAMWLATAAVTLLYVGLNAVFLYGPPLTEVAGAKDVALIAADSLGGFWLTEMVRAVVLISLATSVLAMIQIGPHVYAQMARDRLLPGWLASSHPTPRYGLLLQAGLAIFLIVFTNLLELLEYLAFLLSLSSAATVACLLLPRFRGKPGARPVVGWPGVPILFIVATLGIALLALRYRLQTDPRSLLLALAVLPVGAICYAVARGFADPDGRSEERT